MSARQEIDNQAYDAVHMILRVDDELAAYTRIVDSPSQGYISFGRVLVVKEVSETFRP